MQQYKLTYFNLTALGEYIRFLFAYGGIEYEDVRINSDDWAPVKNTFLFGQVPVLDVDGKRITQSMAIGRYLAKVVKINGNNEWEDALIDEAIDHVNDYRARITASFYEPDPELNKIKMEQIRNEFLPYYLDRFDRMVGENCGHFALSRLTAADLLFTATLDYLNKAVGQEIVYGYPNLQKLVTEVRNIPRIKEWIENRPQSPM